ELAGMTKWEFHELLAKEKVVRRYDLEELEKDEEVVRELIEDASVYLSVVEGNNF
ncbi:MAG: hypothetical protein DRO98_05960, partial [Archaeoglobales archaeon]